MDLYNMGTLEVYKMPFRDPFYSQDALDEKGLNMVFCRIVVFKS